MKFIYEKRVAVIDRGIFASQIMTCIRPTSYPFCCAPFVDWEYKGLWLFLFALNRSQCRYHTYPPLPLLSLSFCLFVSNAITLFKVNAESKFSRPHRFPKYRYWQINADNNSATACGTRRAPWTPQGHGDSLVPFRLFAVLLTRVKRRMFDGIRRIQ